MTTWITSDLHFGHKNIIHYCDRPWYTVEEMNDGLVDNWNGSIKNDDLVIVDGDFFMGPLGLIDEILPKLSGTIVLCRGNHDADDKVKRMLRYENVHVTDSMVYDYGDVEFVIAHDPASRAFEPFDFDDGKHVRLYGHIHDNAPTGLRHDVVFEDFDGKETIIPSWSYHVGVDTNGYRPVNLDWIYDDFVKATKNSTTSSNF